MNQLHTNATDLDYGDLIARLSAGAADAPRHRQAALLLLTDHGHWLRHAKFLKTCVHLNAADGHAWIAWRDVEELTGRGLHGSTTELAVLEYATALAVDRYSLSAFGTRTGSCLAQATRIALGLTDSWPTRGGPRGGDPL